MGLGRVDRFMGRHSASKPFRVEIVLPILLAYSLLLAHRFFEKTDYLLLDLFE